MVFEPELSGKYKYGGSLFTRAIHSVFSLALDSEGRFYFHTASKMLRFDSPAATAPSWQISIPETEAGTVDPATGEVFYYSAKERHYHHVKPEGTNEGIDEIFAAAPQQFNLYRATFDPAQSVEGHPPGILYEAEEPDPVAGKAARILMFAPSAKFPPSVDGESVRGVGATFATLEAKIDPKGFDTHYKFQYGTEGPCSSSPCAEAPLGGADAGAGTSDTTVSALLSHLAPSTTYHFRVVAENQFGAAAPTGEDRTFATFAPPEPGPPDGRAYELVSPAEKHGGEVLPAEPEVSSCHECEPGINSLKMPEQSAPGGESIVYEGFPFFPASEGERGALKENEYRATRTATGWQTTNLSPELQTHGPGFRTFTGDLGRSVMQENEVPLAEGALPKGYEDLYAREADGTLHPLIQGLLEPLAPFTLQLEYAGGSADLNHEVFEANEPLTGATESAPRAPAVSGLEHDIYESTGGSLRLVNVLPGERVRRARVGGRVRQAAQRQRRICAGHGNAVSADGSRISGRNSQAAGSTFGKTAARRAKSRTPAGARAAPP